MTGYQGRGHSWTGVAPQPCAYCPYRLDSPSGMWSEEEYARMPDYDNPTPEQPTAAFGCHLANGNLCAGWVGCHDMDESLSLRIGVMIGTLAPELQEEALYYQTDVPLFATATEAAAHGMRDIDDPSEEAISASMRVLRIQNEARRRGDLD